MKYRRALLERKEVQVDKNMLQRLEKYLRKGGKETINTDLQNKTIWLEFDGKIWRHIVFI